MADSDFYGPNGPVQAAFRDLTAPPEPPPQMRAPQAMPTPGFSQWLASLMPTSDQVRNGAIDLATDVLGTPVEGPAWALRQMGVPISWKTAPDSMGGNSRYAGPDVPFGTLWWRNAINNSSLTWDQVRAALQSPSMHSLRGLGSLF